MKKKWELLKYAYDNYPKGTKFVWSAYGNEIVSTGIFNFEYPKILDSNGYCIFDGKDWAKIIPGSILSSKCAIQVDNEREFKLLMEHYVSKGWKWEMGENPNAVPFEKGKNATNSVTYKDRFSWWSFGYKIIPFDQFATEVGIKVPIKIMASEDGVDLYEGDKYCMAKNINATGNKWELCVINAPMDINSFAITDSSNCKAFSTREAADKWIAEQNKPKEIEVKLFGGKTGFVRKDCIDIDDTRFTFTIAPSDLEDLKQAYDSL